MQADNLRIIV